MKIARFVDAGMDLEVPSQVTPFHAVLQNPSFSLLGLLWRLVYNKYIPIHSVVLLYQTCRRSETTEFHVYVIPNDSSVRQVGDNRPAERIVIFYRPNRAENVADGYLKNCRLGVLLRIRLNNLGYLWGACVCQFLSDTWTTWWWPSGKGWQNRSLTAPKVSYPGALSSA